MLAASMSMAVFVVTAIVVDDTWALILGGGVALVLLALWYVLPLSLRERDEDRRERERDAHPSHL